MNLNEVILRLEEIKATAGGEIPVFVNGEHGECEPKMATSDHFQCGDAEFTLGGCKDDIPHGIRLTDTILQIGGY